MQALEAGVGLAHGSFMRPQHVLPVAGGVVAAENDTTLLDEVPFGQLMSSVLKEWGMPVYAGSSDTTALPAAAAPVAALPPPPRAAAPPLQRAAAGGGGVASLRCLDFAHGRGCTECTPAPLDGEDALYELVGDQGKKNGEKKLRALLARCPEWSQDTARLALADTLGGRAECMRLVSCLRGADTMATLRKVDLIALARAWGYRSSQWRRRRACSRATHRALADLGGVGAERGAGPAAGGDMMSMMNGATRVPAQPALGGTAWDGSIAALAATRTVLEPFECATLSSDDVARYGEERLKRLANDAVRLLAGQEAFSAAVNHGWAHITSALCAEIETANSHLEVLLTKWEATLTAVLVLRDEMKQCADDVAWRALAGRESALPIHEMMRQMQTFMDRGVAQINETRRRRGDAAAPPAVEAWLNELHHARMMALELIARSQALLINARFAHVQMFLGVCMLVHGACTHFFTQGRASMLQRLSWMRSLLAVSDDGCNAEARGVAAAAAALYASPFAAPA